jgi:hypothetical protein
VADHTVELELVGNDQLARDLVAGGLFVPGYRIALNEECELVLRGVVDELRLLARVVFANDTGIGLQLYDCDADLKRRITALAAGQSLEQPPPAEEPAAEEPAAEAGDEERKLAPNMHERLRGLTLVQQLKIASSGEMAERIVLERMYGKNVWEPLLRNPRVTGPEVARIARMGALPRPMIEMIVGNGAWLQIPEVRRALLSNPRLATDQVLRILRLLPKHELKLAAIQTAYPMPVRDAARRMLRELGG